MWSAAVSKTTASRAGLGSHKGPEVRVMLLTLCTKVTAGTSLDESIAVATRYGFDGLEIFGLPEHLPPDVPTEEVVRYAEMLRDVGLRVWCLATYVGPYGDADAEKVLDFLDQVRRYCEFADLLGCEYVRQVTAYGSPETLAEEVWQRTAEGLRQAADVAAEYGKRLVVETHDRQIVETVDSTLRLLEMVGRANVGITFDPGNHVRHAQDYGPEAVRRYGERLWNVHVKDCSLGGEQRLFGEGDMDYGLVWQGLADIGYDGAIGIECHVQPSEELPLDALVQHEIEAVRASLAQSPLASRLG